MTDGHLVSAGRQIATTFWGSAWRDNMKAACAGGIDSVVELLQGRFSKGVMELAHGSVQSPPVKVRGTR